MENLYTTLLGITILFFVLLGVKELFSKKIKKRFCIVCLAVSLTWIALLGLHFLGLFQDKILIAILIGQSSLGLFYVLYDKLNVFKLVFLLTLTSGIYFVFEGLVFRALYFLLILWVLFFVFYLFKRNKNLGIFANKIVECCRKW